MVPKYSKTFSQKLLKKKPTNIVPFERQHCLCLFKLNKRTLNIDAGTFKIDERPYIFNVNISLLNVKSCVVIITQHNIKK